jgi:type II secretory pathway pseudopilin PulG
VPAVYARPGARARGSRGETLLELLVTVSIVGTAFMGILAGIGTTFNATDSQRKGATAESVLRSYAERIGDPTDVPYVNCATTATYGSPTGFALPAAGWSASVTTVNQWQGDTPPTFTPSCPSPDKGLQQLTLTVTSPAGAHQLTANLVIVKRKP